MIINNGTKISRKGNVGRKNIRERLHVMNKKEMKINVLLKNEQVKDTEMVTAVPLLACQPPYSESLILGYTSVGYLSAAQIFDRPCAVPSCFLLGSVLSYRRQRLEV